jgi:hypothetical protein
MGGTRRAEYETRRSELEVLNDRAAAAAASGDPQRCHEVAERLAALSGRLGPAETRLLELKARAEEIRRDLLLIAEGSPLEDSTSVWFEGAD